MIYELLAFSTEDYTDIRYRDYTTSKKKAEAFENITKIEFSDSGHGIVFVANKVSSRKNNVFKDSGSCREHVRKYMK